MRRGGGGGRMRATVTIAAAAALAAACSGGDAPDQPTEQPRTAATPAATATVRPSPTPALTPLGDTCDSLFPEGLEVGQVVDDKFVCFTSPLAGEPVGGLVSVAGFSAGAFEASIVVELRDAVGNVLAMQPVQVAQPEIGLYAGDWSVTIEVPPPGTAGGAIVAYATSPRDGSIDFEASMAVRFGP